MKSPNKKYYQTLLLLLTILIAYSLQLNATIRYVSKTGNSTPPYTSWETAAESIQECINVCVSGDTIYVANGVYQEQVVMIPGLSLIGAGMDSCVINTQSLVNSNGFVAVEVKDNCLLRGFKVIVYNNNDKGFGIVQGTNSYVINNRIMNAGIGIYTGWTGTSTPVAYQNNIVNVQMGFWINNSSPLVKNNTIYPTDNNVATIIAGIFMEANTNIYLPIIDSNFIETGGDGIYKLIHTRAIIKNNIIILSGGGSEGIRVSSSDSTKIFNNLIIGKNVFEVSDAIINYGVQYLTIYNNFITGHYSNYILLMGPNDNAVNNSVVNAAGWIAAYTGGNLQYRYNDVWNSNIGYGFTPDTTNLSVDPMVVNDDTTQGELDFHLQAYSPLIDAGDPTILDRDGSRSDIGLYGGPYGESYTYQDLAPKPPRGLFANVDSSAIELTWQKNTEADFNHYNLYRDTTNNFQIDSTKLVASMTDTFYLHSIPPVERLYFKLTGVNNQGNESNPSEEVAVILVSVNNEWKPVNNYILYQNYPNPFNPSTTISYKLIERSYVKLYVYDVKGELVEVLVNQTQEAGYYEVEFNGDGKTELIGVKNPFVSGVYLCQIIVQSENGIPVFSDSIKMVLLKLDSSRACPELIEGLRMTTLNFPYLTLKNFLQNFSVCCFS